jgi:sulfite exporter TauE/SafE
MLEHPIHLALAADADALGLVSALFVAGLVGGFLHCAAMCGPFVIAQVLARADGAPTLVRAHLLPYHLGRATTYVLLGAALGAVGEALSGIPALRSADAALLAIAGVFFALQAIGRAPGGLSGGWIAGRVRGLLAAPEGIRGYALGLALGFLPCGFLYGALAAASGSGGAGSGAVAMLGFVLGTVPSLAVVQVAGAMAARRWQAALVRIGPPLMLFNAAALLALAWRALD